jgi:leader peptidase (prepilin peptidase) / N-methyltransferase
MDMNIILEEIPRWQFVLFAALFGAAWGSFANVVIVRWPLEQSVMRPGSHCMKCGAPVRFFDNIPVLSYIILGGRCRSCKASFSPKYAVVELASALLSVGVMNNSLLNHPPSFLLGLTSYFVGFAFIWALLTAAMIDLDTFLLPDSITLPGIVIGIAVNTFVYKTGWIDPVTSAAGSYAGLSLLFVHGYKRLTGRRGMGEGDPKLLAMIGAFLLLKGALFALFAGAFQGLIAGSILVLYRRRTGRGPEPPKPDDGDEDENDAEDADTVPFRWAKVPFGPFLALGAVEYYFFGDRLIALYAAFIRDLTQML